MKKIVIALAAISATFLIARAEMLFWQVTAEQFDAAGLTSEGYSRLVWMNSGSMDYEGTTEWYQGAALQSENVTTVTGNENYSYYIELATYDSALKGDYTLYGDDFATGFAYSSFAYSADDLPSISLAQVAWSGSGSRPGPAPEPTSGLMMLVGMALLGLKRRRV